MLPSSTLDQYKAISYITYINITKCFFFFVSMIMFIKTIGSWDTSILSTYDYMFHKDKCSTGDTSLAESWLIISYNTQMALQNPKIHLTLGTRKTCNIYWLRTIEFRLFLTHTHTSIYYSNIQKKAELAKAKFKTNALIDLFRLSRYQNFFSEFKFWRLVNPIWCCQWELAREWRLWSCSWDR